MKRPCLLLIALLTVLLSGCVSTKTVPLRHDQLAQLSGASVASTSRPRPDFSMFKAGNAMFGAIGGLASVSAGNDLVKQYDLKDPAPAMAEELIRHLTASFRVIPQPAPGIPIDTQDVAEISTAAAGKADLVLDVQTVNWSLVYLPTKWTRYRLVYTSKLRLVDARRKEMIAEGFFTWEPPKDAEHPTYDELLADNAAKLRAEIKTAAEHAIAAFKSGVLKPVP